MKPRQRVLKILNHEEADRTPVDLGGIIVSINTDKYFEVADYLGIEAETSDTIVSKEWVVVPQPSEAMLERFGVDFRRVFIGEPDNFQPYVDKEKDLFIDEWGLTWQRVGFYMEIVNNPLRDGSLREALAYPFPDPTDPGRYRNTKENARRLYEETDYCVVGGAAWPVVGEFDMGCWLFGHERFMTELILDKKLVRAFFDRYIEFQKEVFDRYLDEIGPYIQVIQAPSSDFGTQQNLFISPDLYREMIKPYHQEIIQFIKSKAPHVKVLYHSDGSVFDLIPDFIEIGIDILNPIQPLVKRMEPWRLKQTYGDQIAFHGGIDVQDVLPNWSPEAVSSNVKEVIEELSPGGGYILAACHNIQPDVPPENVVAMFDAALEYGKYPVASQ